MAEKALWGYLRYVLEAILCPCRLEECYEEKIQVVP